MKRLLGLLSVIAVVVMLAGVVEACTATSTVDKAKQNKDTDEYKAARDVAEEFVDEEGFEKDEPTYEAGTGVLLTELDYGKTVSNGGKDASDWKAILDTSSARGHGIDKTGGQVYSNCTVRDHMRMHVKEWDDALKGNNPSLMDYWNNGGYGQLVSKDHAG